MNPNDKQQPDIIDAAMAGDDYDYGDKPETNQSEDPNEDDLQESESSSQQEPGSVRQEAPDKDTREPGQVPVTKPGQVQQPGADQNNPLGLKRVGAQFADGKGNIVDKDGKIVARAGESARLWQEASRANAQVSNLTRQLTQMQRERDTGKQLLESAKEIAELPQKLGISKEDYNEGITLLSNWNKNPVGVAREIVARAVALGYNVSDIVGKTAGDAVELKSITHLVNQATAPLREQQEAKARETEATRKANEAYEQFLNTYPEAELHGNEIANLMNKGRSATEAYYQVKMFAMENGLDFEAPLGPQVAALVETRRSGGQRNTEQRRTPASLGPGNGRGNESQMTTQPEMADANDDWGSILNSVMRQTQ